jgi:hypothetical protein
MRPGAAASLVLARRGSAPVQGSWRRQLAQAQADEWEERAQREPEEIRERTERPSITLKTGLT